MVDFGPDKAAKTVQLMRADANERCARSKSAVSCMPLSRENAPAKLIYACVRVIDRSGINFCVNILCGVFLCV